MDKIGLDPNTIQGMSIASNAYVPYPSLRNERPFLYDEHSYPLHTILAQMLRVDDLTLLHEHEQKQDKALLLSPLLDPRQRKAFHLVYDNFVNTFCIPLLHSLAMVQKMFNQHSSTNQDSSKVCYRYQAFPSINVIRPGEFSDGPHCDLEYGHSMGNINFHIPLTPTYGTNALYTESHPGREDWHPLKTKSVGLGFCFDGARCLHFTLQNTTEITRVSLDFRIAIYREKGKGVGGGGGVGSGMMSKSMSRGMNSISKHLHLKSSNAMEQDDDCDVHDSLCNQKMLQDTYSAFPGYYEDAHVDLGTHSTSGFSPGPIVQKRNHLLMHPDKRVGFPF